MASPTMDALAGFDFESDGVVDIKEQLAHVWQLNPAYDDVGCALGVQVEALSGFATLAKHNIRPERCRSQPFVMHAKDTSEPHLSCYSDAWFKLLAHEWSASDITPSFSGEGAENYDLHTNEDATTTRFHGTTVRAVKGMMSAGGFIPGPNGHGRRGKYLLGLFNTGSLGEAFQRVDPWRAIGCDFLHVYGCPVVVELKVATLQLHRYHQHRSDLRVVVGSPGKLMQGVLLKKVHVNRRYFSNYVSNTGRPRSEICGQNSPGCTSCGQFISIAQQNQLCKRWSHESIGYKAGSGIVYCPHCAGMVCNRSQVIGRDPLYRLNPACS